MDTHGSDDKNHPPKIAIAATFVAEPLEHSLLFWMHELGMPEKIAFAPYNQVFQELLHPASLFATNRDGINVILARLEDWSGASGLEQTAAHRNIESNVGDLLRGLISAVERSATSYLLCLCPSSPSQASDSQGATFFKRMQELMLSELADVPGVHVVTASELTAAYPVTEYYDAHTDQLAHIPFTPLFFTALGTLIARRIYALKNTPFKVVALDCDDTLWSGVCGEDGPTGVMIDPARNAIQRFLLRQQAAGMLLCLCSKNNEEDVLEVFAGRPEMPLRPEHIVVRRINWKPKSENLRSLAQELQLGLDSFIFIDDDPIECAEVQANCPEVLTLQLPSDLQTIPRFLEHIWAFDHVHTTAEDTKRTELYRQNAVREQFRTESLTFQEFLEGLGLEVQISAPTPDQLERITELTHRTNQFNLAPVKRSAGELDRLLRSGESECLVVQVRDRFGDYGLVGVMIFRAAAKAITVDAFLLSCRALGRGVEHRMLAKLAEIAKRRGLERVDLPLSVTPKNEPVHRFLDRIGAEFKEPSSKGFLFRFPVEFASAISSITETTTRENAETVSPVDPPEHHTAGAQAKARLLSSIAAELCDAGRIHKWAAAQILTRPQLKTAFVEPRTSLETQLAEMCSDLLGIDRVGINDSFFELGGHSLLATQLLSRLRGEFQIDLSPRLLFTTEFTVAEIAKAVVKQQAKELDGEEVAQILRAVEKLSDDEVRVLLGVKAGEGSD